MKIKLNASPEHTIYMTQTQIDEYCKFILTKEQYKIKLIQAKINILTMFTFYGAILLIYLWFKV